MTREVSSSRSEASHPPAPLPPRIPMRIRSSTMRRNSMSATRTAPVSPAVPDRGRTIVVNTGAEPPPSPRSKPAAIVKAYITLTKPRIVELLLITTIPTMFLAARLHAGGLPDLVTVLVVVIGGAMAAGAANAINCYFDRDIDQLMRRTSRRPIPQHTIAPERALTFGLVLAVVSIALIWSFTNLLAASLTLASRTTTWSTHSGSNAPPPPTPFGAASAVRLRY